jgi:hypothetical protein
LVCCTKKIWQPCFHTCWPFLPSWGFTWPLNLLQLCSHEIPNFNETLLGPPKNSGFLRNPTTMYARPKEGVLFAASFNRYNLLSHHWPYWFIRQDLKSSNVNKSQSQNECICMNSSSLYTQENRRGNEECLG